MTTANTYIALSGNDPFGSSGVETMSSEELCLIAQNTNDIPLQCLNDIGQIFVKCYSRDHTSVVDIALKYRTTKARTMLDIFRVFYEGISSLVLARETQVETQRSAFRQIGEKAVKTMLDWKKHNEWNFENKLLLLQAELHYLNKDFNMACSAFEASIESAQEHTFVHEEALSYERFALFLSENRMMSEGKEKLDKAIEKYAQWGAMSKVYELKQRSDEDI